MIQETCRFVWKTKYVSLSVCLKHPVCTLCLRRESCLSERLSPLPWIRRTNWIAKKANWSRVWMLLANKPRYRRGRLPAAVLWRRGIWRCSPRAIESPAGSPGGGNCFSVDVITVPLITFCSGLGTFRQMIRFIAFVQLQVYVKEIIITLKADYTAEAAQSVSALVCQCR